ncbi:MAG TPA: MFS transporter [Azospirillaceae bacterium]|nr:MFS transporter [Azospirillaceae bacterium]
MADLRNSAYPPPRTAWPTLLLLVGAVLLAYVDRQVIAVLVEPIRTDLGLTDTQFGLVQGPAFALAYALAALPLGRLVDRRSRRNLILGGLAVWSASTLLCAVATDFWTLLLFRAGVGMGEACLIPAVFSLIPDLFPPERRASAYAVYMATVVPGVSLSLAFAGSALAWIERGIPFLPELAQSWRLTFVLVALPAPLFAGLFLLMREPARQERVAAGGAGSAIISYIRRNLPLLAAVGLGGALASVAFTAWLAWLPALMGRRFGVPPAEAGLWGGIAAAAASVIGGLLAARVAARLRGRPAPEMSAALLLAGLALPAAAAVFAATSPAQVLGAMGVQAVAWVAVLTLWPVMIAAVTPNEFRGQIVALVKLVEYLLISVAAVAVGMLSDHFFPRPEQFPTALYIVAAVAALGSAVALALGQGRVRAGTATDAPPAEATR